MAHPVKSLRGLLGWRSGDDPGPALAPAKLIREDAAPSPIDPAQADHFLEQYKIFVETEERLVSRRQEENRFFLSVNALMLTVISFLFKQGVHDRAAWLGIAILAGAGLVLCYAWMRTIQSYRTLNKAKFAVIDSFETVLPARMFGAEWEAAQARNYQPFTRIEERVPAVFGLLHLIGFVVGLLGLFHLIH
jgi:hypothetical protein